MNTKSWKHGLRRYWICWKNDLQCPIKSEYIDNLSIVPLILFILFRLFTLLSSNILFKFLEINELYKKCNVSRPYIVALTANITNDENKYLKKENGAMNAYMAKPISLDIFRHFFETSQC